MKPLYQLVALPGLAQMPAQMPLAVQVRVERTEGSAPRDAGATLVCLRESFFGTIGGGHLEHVALAHARRLLESPPDTPPVSVGVQRWALGPSMGQCCGGVVWVSFTLLDAQDLMDLGRKALQACPPAAVLGGGHVGEALVRQLLLLDYRVLGFDSRENQFSECPQSPLLRCEHVDPITDAVDDLPAGCHVLIMSFSHAEDLELVHACLRRQAQHADLGFIGLIGSASKWARFQHRLQERGHLAQALAGVTCPVGHPKILGKEPATIALAVATQLAMLRQA